MNDLSFKGGMDIKYGLNESFTLDMMLIPDFGQTQADDIVLNLTSIETKYNEKRQFFTEGMELFRKGDIFYSRRIGGQPFLYESVSSQLSPSEIVMRNPSETFLYNATKISGHNQSGLGVGVLNAVTQEQEALIIDTITGISRKYITQGISNYNMVVVDKDIGKGSYISWLNTNVFVPEFKHMANVSGFDFKYNFSDYEVFADAFLSYINDKAGTHTENELGQRLNLDFAKLKGTFRYVLKNSILTNTYDPSDFGYLGNNNLISNVIKLQYFQYTPSKHFNEITSDITFSYENLYKPLSYSRFEASGNLKLIYKSLNYIRFIVNVTPVVKFDYFEPRVEGWKFKEPTAAYAGIEYSSDFRKKLAFKILGGYWQASRFNKSTSSIRFQPHYRANDRLSLDLQFILAFLNNNIGYVAKSIDSESIYFGRRKVTNIENTALIKYSISNKSFFNMRVRHYWSNVNYKAYYLLQQNGEIMDIMLSDNYDANVNLFNLDFSYSWQFMPGSELSVVWKNYYSVRDQNSEFNYFENLGNVFSYSKLNNLSLRFIYYIDYKMMKNIFLNCDLF